MTIEYWNKHSKNHKRRTIADGLIGTLIFRYIVAAYDHHLIIDLGVVHESAAN